MSRWPQMKQGSDARLQVNSTALMCEWARGHVLTTHVDKYHTHTHTHTRWIMAQVSFLIMWQTGSRAVRMKVESDSGSAAKCSVCSVKCRHEWGAAACPTLPVTAGSAEAGGLEGGVKTGLSSWSDCRWCVWGQGQSSYACRLSVAPPCGLMWSWGGSMPSLCRSSCFCKPWSFSSSSLMNAWEHSTLRANVRPTAHYTPKRQTGQQHDAFSSNQTSDRVWTLLTAFQRSSTRTTDGLGLPVSCSDGLILTITVTNRRGVRLSNESISL